MQRPWRDRVYSGLLRESPPPMAETKQTLIQTMEHLMLADNRPHCFNTENYSLIEPGLYLGDGYAAMDLALLQREGFTHVLNVAEGSGIGSVNTNANYYHQSNIKYMGVSAYDRCTFPLDGYFMQCVYFIRDALASRGKILVNCVMGISRSATIVVAYLIVSRQIRASEALKIVYQRRIVQPNDGFLDQLARFSNAQERRNYKAN